MEKLDMVEESVSNNTANILEFDEELVKMVNNFDRNIGFFHISSG